MKKAILRSILFSATVFAVATAPDWAAGQDGQATNVTVQTVTPGNQLRFQTTIDKKFVSKVYPLRDAKAAEIQPLIQAVVDPEYGTVSSLSFDGSEMLVVSAPTYMIPRLDATVAALDTQNISVDADGTGDLYYRPKHRLPSELAGLAEEAGASSLVTTVPDDVNNLIYFSDTPVCLEAIAEALKAFDVPQAQAEIEVKIVEINEGDNERIGFLWDTWKKALPESVDVTYGKERSRSAADGYDRTTSWSVDFSTVSPQALADFVNYMARHGAPEIKTTTRLNCVQRTVATVTAGDVHRFLTAAQPREDGAANKLVSSVVDGLVLNLTPYIGTESIRLEIDSKVNSLSGFDPNGLPVVNSRTVTATAVLTDGQVFALTGLQRRARVKTKDRVFLLGHIPVIGDWLFTTHSTTDQKSQLIVILTPRLLKHGGSGVRTPEASESSNP